jgi:hypothetical protein
LFFFQVLKLNRDPRSGLTGHADVKTMEIYTHVMQKDISVVCSPLDKLPA